MPAINPQGGWNCPSQWKAPCWQRRIQYWPTGHSQADTRIPMDTHHGHPWIVSIGYPPAGEQPQNWATPHQCRSFSIYPTLSMMIGHIDRESQSMKRKSPEITTILIFQWNSKVPLGRRRNVKNLHWERIGWCLLESEMEDWFGYKYLSGRRVLHHPGMTASVFLMAQTQFLCQLNKRQTRVEMADEVFPKNATSSPWTTGWSFLSFRSFFQHSTFLFSLALSNWGSSQKL